MRDRLLLILIMVSVVFMTAPAVVADVPTLIGYQGVLLDSEGDPVTEPVNVTFIIYDSPSNGTISWQETQLVEFDESGRFDVSLGESTPITDDVFNDPVRWLGVQVEGDDELVPRTRIVSVAYANRISTVDGATGGTISGDVAIQSDLDVDGDIRVIGKATIGAGHVNTGAYAFVAGENNTSSADYATVGGGLQNTASFTYATVAGGVNNAATGEWSTVAGGVEDTASGSRSMVGGGVGNTASGPYSIVGGGYHNSAIGIAGTVAGGQSDTASGHHSVVGGGQNNTAGGNHATVGGGQENTASGNHSVIGGGQANATNTAYNTVSGGYNNSVQSDYGTVCGGQNNTVINEGNSAISGGKNNTIQRRYSFIGGGSDNYTQWEWSVIGGGWGNATVGARCTIGGGMNNVAGGGTYATVGGGQNNTASGSCAVIPGGCGLLASGDYSFAAGSGAKAIHNGAFVWADAAIDELESTADNQIMMLGSGGTWIYSDPDLLSGVTIHPGASAWATYSDRSLKENLTPVDSKEVLQKISSLPVNEWNFKAQSDNIKHIGPTAQDFYATFGLGDDDKTISTIDPSGVALAGIQALLDKINQLETRIAELEGERR